MDSDRYCQQRAAASGSSFYYSFLFLSGDRRRAITALYAFCREVDDVVDECTDPAVARVKLQWWREELDRAFDGAPQHPVTQSLQPHLQSHRLPREYFQEIIDGMEMDLDRQEYATFDELAAYCHRVAGVVGQLSAEIFGYQNERTLKYAHELGMGFQLTNIIRDVHEDARRGRVYLPQEDMNRYGVVPNDLMHAHTPDSVRSLLHAQAQRARGYYERAMDWLPDSDRYRQRSGLIMAEIYRTLLDEMARDGFPVLEGRIALTPLRKLWIAWRVAKREQWRRRRQRVAAHMVRAR